MSNRNHRTIEQKAYDVNRILAMANAHVRGSITYLYDNASSGVFELENVFVDGEIKMMIRRRKRRILEDLPQSTRRETDKYARNIESELEHQIKDLLDEDPNFHGAVVIELVMFNGAIVSVDINDETRFKVGVNEKFKKKRRDDVETDLSLR